MMIIRVRKTKRTSSLYQVKLFKNCFASCHFPLVLWFQHSVLQDSVWFYQFSCVNFNHLLSCFAFYHYSLSWREADAFSLNQILSCGFLFLKQLFINNKIDLNSDVQFWFLWIFKLIDINELKWCFLYLIWMVWP